MKHLLTAFMMLCFLHLHAQEIFAPAGKAINGYDPVAFFKLSKPVMGADSLSYQWKGATWLFSDKEDMKTFIASPEKYAPQYGGYCAYGTADGHKAPTQTDTWTIVDDKLYFNYNSKVKEMWTKDQKNLIIKADKNWPLIK
jgi:YHS domain-containing protein